jgi:phosphoribosylaminoimidazole carboxylase (NCAIR synthetase)
MTSHAAQTLGYHTIIFTDQENSPANFATNKAIVADYQDQEALKKFAQLIDVATFEFENIPKPASVERLILDLYSKFVKKNPEVLREEENPSAPR